MKDITTRADIELLISAFYEKAELAITRQVHQGHHGAEDGEDQ